jgi:glycosyltransferase involved in cell wall biosynthesis
MNTINSIKQQTHTNIEIIVVNDCSTQKEYYDYDWLANNIIIKHLEENTKTLFGFACAGYVRNKGIEISSGKYIAFCDDDDTWVSAFKIEFQIKSMKESGCKISSTDGFIGHGPYNSENNYKKYNAEHYYQTLQDIYKGKGSSLLENGFAKIWSLEFLKVHNCVICSSVLVEKEILDKINNLQNLKNGQEDYDCWLRLLEYTNLAYVEEPCFYYDLGHGYGQNY